MIMSRWGFNPNVQGIEYLDKIYDLMEGKLTIKNVGWHKYLVYEDDAITEEVKELQSKLSKPWFSYKNYKWNVDTAMSETCYQSRLKAFEKEQERQFKKDEERRQKAIAKQKREEARQKCNRGVYGIFVDRELIYVGKTNVDFEVRFEQHKEALQTGNNQYVYQHIRKLKEERGSVSIEFKPIVNVLDLKLDGNITNRDIEAMELAMIQLFKPVGNIQGVLQDYKFS